MKTKAFRIAAVMTIICLLGAWAALKMVPRLSEYKDAQAAAPARPDVEIPEAPADLLVLSGDRSDLTYRGGLLERELVRQAVLIAARDELGLRTRDANLRERFDNIPYAIEAMRVNPSLDGENVKVYFWHEKRAYTSKPLERSLGAIAENERIALLAVRAEAFSRREFVDDLKSLRFKKTSDQKVADSSDPPTAELTDQFNPISQYAAVRRWHAAMRVGEETEQQLIGLVRGYANLGFLTQHHWSPASKVFSARALLYAERLLNRTGETSGSIRWRAYARMLAGLPTLALADLERAAEIGGEQEEVPGWVMVIEARCRGDVDELERLSRSAQGADRVLARLIRLQDAESARTEREVAERALEILEIAPSCVRGLDGVLGPESAFGARSLAASDTWEAADDWLYEPLAESGVTLPFDVAVRKIRDDEGKFRKDILDLLVRESQFTNDHGEPSLFSLGRLIEEEGYYQAWRIVDNIRYSVSTDADGWIEETRPWVSHHPYRAFLDSMAWNSSGASHLAEILSRIGEETLVPAMWPMRDRMLRDSIGWHGALDRRLVSNRDDTVNDLVWWGDKALHPIENRLFAQRLERIDPHSPVTATRLIRYDTERVIDRIPEWEKRFAKQNPLMSAIANWHAEEEQYKEASQLLERCLEASRDFATYDRLAAIRFAAGDEDGYIEALEASMQLPAMGLEHARANRRIADFLMGNGQWSEAKPYALRAAESYSGWGLACAAECYEGLGDYATAETYRQALSEWYADSAADWFFWCLRTNRGDIEAARATAAPVIEKWESANGRYQTSSMLSRALILYVEGDKTLALEQFQKLAEVSRSGYDSMMVAVVADELGQEEVRNEYLELAVNRSEDTDLSVGVLARAFRANLTGEAIDPTSLRQRVIELSTTNGEVTNAEYFLGRFLETRGRVDEARRLYESAASSPWYGKYSCLISALSVRRLGGTVAETRLHEVDEDFTEMISLFNDGVSYLGRMRYEAARRRFDKALSLYPRHLPSFGRRSEPLLQLDRAADALADVDAVLAVLPDHHGYRIWRGRVLEALGQNEEAVAEYQRVLDSQPTRDNKNSAHNNLCWLYASSRDAEFRNPQAAMKHAEAFEPSKDLTQPTPPDEWHTQVRAKAVAKAALGDTAGAAKSLQMNMDEIPDWVRPSVDYQLACYRAGRPYIRPERWWMRFDGSLDGAVYREEEQQMDRAPVIAPRPGVTAFAEVAKSVGVS